MGKCQKLLAVALVAVLTMLVIINLPEKSPLKIIWAGTLFVGLIGIPIYSVIDLFLRKEDPNCLKQ